MNFEAIMVSAIMVRIVIGISTQDRVTRANENYARMMASKLVTKVLSVRS